MIGSCIVRGIKLSARQGSEPPVPLLLAFLGGEGTNLLGRYVRFENFMHFFLTLEDALLPGAQSSLLPRAVVRIMRGLAAAGEKFADAAEHAAIHMAETEWKQDCVARFVCLIIIL